MERTLILVDDEPNILAALQRVFRREGYRIVCGESGEAGLAILAEHPIAVVISDQRMPHMTGAEFLSRAREQFPETIRIILSGYTELNSVFDAINRGAVYKFLTKPWDDQLLREQVASAFEQLELRFENARLVAEIQEKNSALEAFNQKLVSEVARSADTVALEERSLLQVQALLDTIPVGLLGLDGDGLVVFANSAIHALLPTAQGLTGSPLLDLQPAPLRQALHAALARRQPSSQALMLGEQAYWLDCRPHAQDDDSLHMLACLYPAQGVPTS